MRIIFQGMGFQGIPATASPTPAKPRAGRSDDADRCRTAAGGYGSPGYAAVPPPDRRGEGRDASCQPGPARRVHSKREARRAESRDRSDARKHEKDEARREKVEQTIAPYLADGDDVAYLVKFKQGEEIFTDYLAVTPRSLP